MSKHRENWLNYCLFHQICFFVCNVLKLYGFKTDEKVKYISICKNKIVLVNFTENSSYSIIIVDYYMAT